MVQTMVHRVCDGLNPSFIADYNHLVKSTIPVGQDPNMWKFELIDHLKKESSQKRIISV